VDSDEALMRRLQAGETPALGELFSRYRSRLYGFLVRRVGDSNADDLFQETWLRVVRGKERFDPDRRFSTWLFQIANNLCRDSGRRRAVKGKAEDAMREAGRADPRAREPSLDLRLHVRRRIAELPERLQEVLLLRYFEQMTEGEIAEVVGIPTGTVKSRLHAAIHGLRGREAVDDAG
jgi:RNA polymerase sigma-70 factor (ECF subfamily)